MLSEIYAHTKGVIFLGTPHRGSSKEGLGEVVLKLVKFRQPIAQLLQTLRDDSHILETVVRFLYEIIVVRVLKPFLEATNIKCI